MASRLLDHCVPVDVGQQTEAKPVHDGDHENGEGEDGGHDEDDDGDQEDGDVGDDSLFPRLKNNRPISA